MATEEVLSAEYKSEGSLKRQISWLGAFFVSAGVPPLVLFSMGGVSATVGSPAWVIWTVSVIFGFIQAFTYAEIAGLHPKKTGGTAVHGATAWLRYVKLSAPMSLWSNWLAWSPVLAIGSGLGAGYLLSIFFSPTAAVNTWQITLVPLEFLKEGLSLRINATAIIGAVILLLTFAVQHRGILSTAKVQTVLTVVALLPLGIVTIIPLLTGDVLSSNFSPFTPLVLDNAGNVLAGHWDIAGWQLIMGGMFIAAWSTYGFETAVCYMSELKNPARDTPRAILYSGLCCIVFYVVVPIVFQGVLGTKGMLDPGIYSGAGVGLALAGMVHAGPLVSKLLVVMLIFSLVMAIMTSMAGSSRTLYQGGNDGWLPKYLDHVNTHGAPTRAMWTDLCFNLVLLLMSDYLFILAASNVNYLIFNFLNLQAGWIHRVDNPDVPRPWRCPTWLIAAGACLAYVNAFFIGAGATVWGKGTLLLGFGSAALVVPVFYYRHNIVDKGTFPQHMWDDLLLAGKTQLDPTRCGIRPYLALAGGFASVALGYVIFWT
ncbi:MAG: APC family permease [Deltaproteobacteria bacterium]|nr:APC family permease [Deltaproteobacteria bacterium]